MRTVTSRVASIAGKTVRASRRACTSARPDRVSARRMPRVMATMNSQRSAITIPSSVVKSARSVTAASRSSEDTGGFTADRGRPASAETGTKR